MKNSYITKVERPEQYIPFGCLAHNYSIEEFESNLRVDTVRAISNCGYDIDREFRHYYCYNDEITDCIEKKVNTIHISKNNKIYTSIPKYENNLLVGYRTFYTTWNLKRATKLIYNHLYPHMSNPYSTQFVTLIDNSILIKKDGEVLSEEIKFGLKNMKKTLAFTIKEYSDVFVLDKDNHSGNELEKQELEFFKKDVVDYFGIDNIFLREKSYSNGLHVYIKLNQKVTKETRTNILKTFKEKYKYTSIENPSAIRMFGSFNYRIIKTTSDQYNYDNTFDNIIDAIQDINIKKELSSGFNVTDFIIETVVEQDIDAFALALKSEKELYENEPGSAYFRKSKHKSYKEFFKKELQTNAYQITDGNRVEIQKKIVRSGYFFRMTPKEIHDIVSANGSTSKDIRSWNNSDTWLKDITYMYNNYAIKPYAKQIEEHCNKPKEYYSNSVLVPIQLKRNIKKTVKHVCKNIGYSQKESNLNAIELLLNEFYGKAFYQIEHEKEVTKEYYKKYTEGFQFSKKEALLLKSKYPDIFKRINPYLFGLLILRKSNLFKLHIRHFNFKNKAFNKTAQWKFNIESSYVVFDDLTKVTNLIKDSLKKFIKKVTLVIKIKSFLKDNKKTNYNNNIVYLFKCLVSKFDINYNENWSPG